MTDTLIAPIEAVDLQEMVDYSVPCEYEDETKCQNKAEWIIHLLSHCVPGGRGQRLMCDDHLRSVQAGEWWRCQQCGSLANIKKYIWKIEPL